MIRVLVGTAHECCNQTMTLQALADELTGLGLLQSALHVCLACGLTLELSCLVPHARIDELRGKRAPGGRPPPAAADLASVVPGP